MCEEIKKTEVTEAALMEVQQHQNYSPADVFKREENFSFMWRLAKTFATSAIVPANYQNKPADCMIAIDMANRMNVSPMMVMQNLFVVKGKPSWSGQACFSFIQNSGKFRNVKHVMTGMPDDDTRGCYVEAIRLSDGEIVRGTEVTYKMAKDMGWWSKTDKYGNETSFWQKMPEQMLIYRASAFFARAHCPEMLMGMYTREEILDMEPSENPAQQIGVTDVFD